MKRFMPKGTNVPFPQSLKVKKLYYKHGVNMLAKCIKFLLLPDSSSLVFQPLPLPALDLRRPIEDVQALEIRMPCIRHHLCHASRMKIVALSDTAPTDRFYKCFDGHTSGLLFRPGNEASYDKCSKARRLAYQNGVGILTPDEEAP
jgi:hypothetical protein